MTSPTDREPMKACPFCGSEAEPYPDGDMEGHSILCTGKGALFGGRADDCPIRTFGFESHEAAVAAWNRRAAPAQVVVTDERILYLWDTHVGEPSTHYPLTDKDKIAFARSLLQSAQPCTMGGETADGVKESGNG